ncbi:hypothetical protein AU255_06880 [Methyloprofundus sedimenti]|uniref:Uncharacterized protein n=1 Tax=Methyloprofundus sedimenti TaxID=1420851 RepID=A0A1V8M7T0_9GAMM|nr:hypothetical protein [Methyloprofundus sedimenti]OQK17589.1 hypothetical protein AU255_06880 [Methyloprofundus sedimenti]
MNGIILTPTKINALFLEEDRYVVPPAVDFSSLPWSDGFHDHNPDTPYLSLSVLNSSFASDTFRLKPGIHLHWLLPAAYRRAFLNSQNGMSHIYCPAPNIWLVRRFSGDGESKEWVVESDVLMPPAYFPHASGSYMPYDSKHGSPPFRMIGRTLALQK